MKSSLLGHGRGGARDQEHAVLPGCKTKAGFESTQDSMIGRTVEEGEEDLAGCRKVCCLQCTEVEVKSSQSPGTGKSRVFTQDESGQGASHGIYVDRWRDGWETFYGRQSQGMMFQMRG